MQASSDQTAILYVWQSPLAHGEFGSKSTSLVEGVGVVLTDLVYWQRKGQGEKNGLAGCSWQNGHFPFTLGLQFTNL